MTTIPRSDTTHDCAVVKFSTPPPATIWLAGTRFGTIQFEAADVVTFPEGVIGFRDLHRYVLISPGEGSPFRWLQSIEQPALAFLLADPDRFVEYDPELPQSPLSEVGIDVLKPHMIWTTANLPAGRPKDMTLNLAGPIVISIETQVGKQIVLNDDLYNVRTPAFAKEGSETGEGEKVKGRAVRHVSCEAGETAPARAA